MTARKRCGTVLVSLTLMGLTGCAQFQQGADHGQLQSRACETDARTAQVQGLKAGLAGLAPAVSEDEADRLASRACVRSRQLAREYRVVRPPLLHNFLVNIGVRKRGLCYQWAEDLLAELQTLNLVTLDLHWGMARAETYREHNSIIVTARGQPFDQGIVLDAWRRSGQLVWRPVAEDKYPWVECALKPSL